MKYIKKNNDDNNDVIAIRYLRELRYLSAENLVVSQFHNAEVYYY